MTNAELQALLAKLPPDLLVTMWLPILESNDWGLYPVENAYIEPFSLGSIILSGDKD